MKTGLYLGGTPIGKIVAASTGGGGLALQSKNVNPTKQTQTITPDAAYDALSQVVVNPIPSNYITTETTSAPEPDQMEIGTTAYANGEIITGTLPIINSIAKELSPPVVNGSKLVLAVDNDEKAIIETDATIHLQTPMEHFGDAKPEDVALGKSFTSKEGLSIAGTHECPPPGADLSDVTATADMILTGYQTYVKDSDIITEGTMTNRGAVNKTLTSNTSYTIPKGYHNGSGKITVNVPQNVVDGEDSSNCTAAASDVRYGKTFRSGGSQKTGSLRTVSIPAAKIEIDTTPSSQVEIMAYTNATTTEGILPAGSSATTALKTIPKYTGSKSFLVTTGSQSISLAGKYCDENIILAGAPSYSDSYSVTPSSNSQTLPTSGCYMSRDITISAMPSPETGTTGMTVRQNNTSSYTTTLTRKPTTFSLICDTTDFCGENVISDLSLMFVENGSFVVAIHYGIRIQVGSGSNFITYQNAYEVQKSGSTENDCPISVTFNSSGKMVVSINSEYNYKFNGMYAISWGF